MLEEIQKAKAKPGTADLVSPRSLEKGELKLVPSRDWTSGFFPGVLWYLYEYSGQDRWMQQARRFTESAGVTGLILTKLDGTAKGGIVVAIARELNLPIRYIGVGEQADDLLPFEPEKFISSLFEP